MADIALTSDGLDCPNINFAEQGSDPATPAGSRWRLYFKAGGLYAMGDDGVPVGPFAVSGSAGSVVVREVDGSPTEPATVIEFPNGTLTEPSAGISRYTPAEAGVGLYDAYVCVADEKAQNTDGGTFTAGAWQKRDLQTERADTAGIASLASNQLTLAAGTYRCLIVCPAIAVGANQARLYDTTGAAVLVLGQNAYGVSTNPHQEVSAIQGRFTIGVESVLEVQHRCTSTQATNGYGVKANFGTEVYTVAEFWRETA